MDCIGLASIQATESGIVDYQGEKLPALKGERLSDGQSMTFYPGRFQKGFRVKSFGKSSGLSLKTSVLGKHR